MAAVLDVKETVASAVSEIVSPAVETANLKRVAHLKAYQFQRGHVALPGSGRPKGMKNAQTSILEAAPMLARHYIKRAAKSDAICIDARKWILPVEDEATMSGAGVVIVITEAAMPRPLSVPADGSATLSAPSAHAVIDVDVDAQRR